MSSVDTLSSTRKLVLLLMTTDADLNKDELHTSLLFQRNNRSLMENLEHFVFPCEDTTFTSQTALTIVFSHTFFTSLLYHSGGFHTSLTTLLRENTTFILFQCHSNIQESRRLSAMFSLLIGPSSVMHSSSKSVTFDRIVFEYKYLRVRQLVQTSLCSRLYNNIN